jgi:hypothetical protein
MNVDHGRSAYPISNNKLITTPTAPQLLSHHNASRIIHKFTESSRRQFQVHLSSQVAFHTKQAIKISISEMPLRRLLSSKAFINTQHLAYLNIPPLQPPKGKVVPRTTSTL